MRETAPGWRLRCRKCGLTCDASKAGITRLRAVGRSYKLGRCQRCNRLRWLVCERYPDNSCPHCRQTLEDDTPNSCPNCGCRIAHATG